MLAHVGPWYPSWWPGLCTLDNPPEAGTLCLSGQSPHLRGLVSADTTWRPRTWRWAQQEGLPHAMTGEAQGGSDTCVGTPAPYKVLHVARGLGFSEWNVCLTDRASSRFTPGNCGRPPQTTHCGVRTPPRALPQQLELLLDTGPQGSSLQGGRKMPTSPSSSPAAGKNGMGGGGRGDLQAGRGQAAKTQRDRDSRGSRQVTDDLSTAVTVQDSRTRGFCGPFARSPAD